MTEKTHLDDMRRFILSVYGEGHQQIDEDANEALSILFEHADKLAATILNIGIDRLSLLLQDRGHAEIVMENCKTLFSKIQDRDESSVSMISEALAKILHRVDEKGLSVSGLTDQETTLLTESVQNFITDNKILTEDIDRQSTNNNNAKLFESIGNLLNKWELFKADDDTTLTYAEGVEYGYSLAAQELKELIEQYTPVQKELKGEGENNG